MKKMRNLFACLSTAAVIATCSLTASANCIIESEAYEEWVASNGYQRYSDYEERLSKLPDHYDDMLYKQNLNTFTVTNYRVREMKEENCVYVYNSYTYYDKLVIHLNRQVTIPSKEEINEYLNENNLKAQITSYNSSSPAFLLETKLTYDEDVTWDDIYAVADALCEKFSFNVYGIFLCSGSKVELETNVSVPTIAGDLDNDSTPGLTDVVKLTKYNANSELYPLADTTALANADVNRDGTIDALDTNLLIEMVLGSYESAF